MKENLEYKTPEGKVHKILMFDKLNKIVYINVEGSNHRWVPENEYSTWVVNDTSEISKLHIPDIPAQMTDEQAASVNEEPAPKRTRKKKSEQ